MKKRMIALLLSLSVLFGSLSVPTKRAQAAPAIGVGVGVFYAAWQIIGIMTGRYDDALDGIRNDMDAFEDYFFSHDSNVFGESESQFVSDWRMGWEIISDNIQSWIDGGKVTTNGDTIKLTYDQYLDLYNQVISVMAAPSVDLKCGFEYTFLCADIKNAIKAENLPTTDLFFLHGGQSYAPVYFNKDTIVFGGAYYLYSPTTIGIGIFSDTALNIFNPSQSNIGGDVLSMSPAFSFPSVSVIRDDCPYAWGVEYAIPYCFVYSNGTLSMETSDSVDVTGMTSGLITTTG
ncbi:MAG: hypothetical protein K2O39_00865, partial [Clostridiales bacterium]|nr:hypothetical protein [Clostridiales bacterium]